MSDTGSVEPLAYLKEESEIKKNVIMRQKK